jgi:hypothetical protein
MLTIRVAVAVPDAAPVCEELQPVRTTTYIDISLAVAFEAVQVTVIAPGAEERNRQLIDD